MAWFARTAHDAVMENRPETLLCDYATTAGRHELLTVRDETTRTYRVLIRRPDGSTRTLRELVPTRRNARRWAVHYRHKALLEDRSRAADLRRAH
jgi:hypothetical protein